MADKYKDVRCIYRMKHFHTSIPFSVMGKHREIQNVLSRQMKNKPYPLSIDLRI